MLSLRTSFNILLSVIVVIMAGGCAAGLPQPSRTDAETVTHALRSNQSLVGLKAFGDCVFARGPEQVGVQIAVRYRVDSLASIEFSTLFGATVAVLQCDSAAYELQTGETTLRGRNDQKINELQNQFDYPFTGRQLFNLVIGRSIDDAIILKTDSIWSDEGSVYAKLSGGTQKQMVHIRRNNAVLVERTTVLSSGTIRQNFDDKGLIKQVSVSSGLHDSLSVVYQQVSGTFE